MDRPIVFVVDDDESICRSLRRLMKSVGHHVRTFTSARDFLNQGCQDMPGCLVLDVKMPGMDGLELQQRLVHAGSRMPIIFMSAQEDFATREQGLRAGAMAFLQKPFEDEILLEKVQTALNEFINALQEQDIRSNDQER